MNLNESQALQACQQGDSTQFGVLYDMYFDRVYRFIYYKTFHTETAEDLTSQTFMKSLEHIGGYDETKGSFLNWIYQIARHTVIDHYRQVKPQLSIDDVWDLQSKQDIAVDVERVQLIEKIQNYLQTLNSEQREILTMRLWEGFTYKEIAKVLGKTEASCKMMYLRAVTKIQEQIILVLFLVVINYLSI